MKPNQRTILIVALLLFLVSVLVVPYAYGTGNYYHSGYQWLFDSNFNKLDLLRLLLEWLGLAAATTLSWLVATIKLPPASSHFDPQEELDI